MCDDWPWAVLCSRCKARHHVVGCDIWCCGELVWSDPSTSSCWKGSLCMKYSEYLLIRSIEEKCESLNIAWKIFENDKGGLDFQLSGETVKLEDAKVWLEGYKRGYAYARNLGV